MKSPPALPTSFPGDWGSFGTLSCLHVRSRLCVRVSLCVRDLDSVFEFRRSAARASASVRRTFREVKTFQSALTRFADGESDPPCGCYSGHPHGRRYAYPSSGCVNLVVRATQIRILSRPIVAVRLPAWLAGRVYLLERRPRGLVHIP